MKICYYLGKIKSTSAAAREVLATRLTAEHISIDTFEYPATMPLNYAISYDDNQRIRTLISTDRGIYETTSKDVADVVELAATTKLPVSHIKLSVEEFQGQRGAGTMLRCTLLNNAEDTQ